MIKIGDIVTIKDTNIEPINGDLKGTKGIVTAIFEGLTSHPYKVAPEGYTSGIWSTIEEEEYSSRTKKGEEES